MSYERFGKYISARFLHHDQQSEKLLRFFFEELSRSLATPFPVIFRGFGTFRRVTLPPRRYYDINSRKIKTRPAKKIVHFYPSKKLLKRL